MLRAAVRKYLVMKSQSSSTGTSATPNCKLISTKLQTWPCRFETYPVEIHDDNNEDGHHRSKAEEEQPQRVDEFIIHLVHLGGEAADDATERRGIVESNRNTQNSQERRCRKVVCCR